MYIKECFVCVYTSEVKTNDRSLSVLEYLQKTSVLCTSKNYYVHKRIWYVQGNMYVHKKNWDLHREGGPWSVKKFEEKRVRFYLQIGSIMEKDVSFVEKFWKDLWKCFWKMKYTCKKFEKESGFESLRKITFKGALKSTQMYRFRLDKNIIGWKFFLNFFDIILK